MPRVLLQRDAELAMLDHRLAQVRSGTGAVIVVEGPAGIGKSSLLAAAGSGAAAAGLRVLSAWGGPLDHDAGWGIARQLFAPVRQSPEWDALAVGAAAPARRALDEDAATPAPTGDAMHAAAHGLTWLTCGLAARAATLLLVDDVHWADAPSLRWLGQLTRRLAGLPLGILCAVRSGEPPAEPDLLAELLAAGGAPVRPSPLEPATVQAIVQGRLPTAGVAFAKACHAATAGNPFLLGALLDHLAAERVEPTADVAAGLSGFGPDQVARAVDRQLARLPAGTADLARAFAVLGRGAKLRHARDLAELDQARACRLADRLRDAGLVEGGADGYALVHPLVEAALYTGLPPGERALWHGRAARLLAGERTDPETVALHLLRTEPAGEPATVTALRTAAGRAWRRGAPQSAATFLRRALAEPPIATYDEAELLSELGLVTAEQVKPQAYDLLADAVALADDPDQRARIALAGTRALGLAGYSDEALKLSRQVLDRAGGADPELLERLAAELVCNAWLDAAEVGDARERTARGGGLPLWAVHRGHLAILRGRPAGEVIAMLRTALDAETDSLLATVLKFDLVAVEELDTVRALCDELIDVARPRGWMTALAHGSFVRAHVLVQAGRVREAVTDARFAFEFKLANPPAPGLVWTLFPLLEALVEADDLDGAEAALAAAARFGAGEPVPGKLRTGMLLERRARLWLARHRPAEAHSDLLAAAETWRALDARHPGLAAWRVDDSAALAALGDLAAARRLAEEHLDLAAGAGLPGARGAGLRALARTVSPADAVPLLTQAAHLLAGSPARLEHARVLVELGGALRRANQRVAAREPLVRALDLADRGGMRLIAARARQELLAAGGRPRRSVATGPGALTPAEHRVAVLAALGHSNREIADQLYVTRRTVETHLTHIFQKLSVSSRAQLATSLPGSD
ncbi:AAA family ATPase [Actinoplanes oblitus]|uniref:AAA family ATPase n=1 Tax=Actinoplanes oblitus TaxID=3040509 RepID=A0ABY8WCG1_9ACTN|nr:LuxR family transcriptional regulator [Actinoplanes oblitus]WIM93390.1 AAA family ATPase [Actinoplanes oblitus]